MKVLSLGAVAMDVVMECSALPEEDGFALVWKEYTVPGGSASNVSVALQRMGAEAYQTGKIGDDKFGIEFREDLEKHGIRTDFLAEKPGGTTLHTYIMSGPNGKHAIFANLGDCVTNLKKEDLPESILDGFTCFYTDMFSPDASLWLGKKAKEQGISVVYNMQCEPDFMESCGIPRENLSEMCSLSDIIISGATGFCDLTGEKKPETALEKLAEKYKPKDGFICTLGSRGALHYSEGKTTTTEPFRITAMDSTGAGDCFTAGFIFGRYIKKWSIPETMRFSTASGALKCEIKGPRTTHTFESIQTFLKRQKKGM